MPFGSVVINGADRCDLFALARRQPQFCASSSEATHALEIPDSLFCVGNGRVRANAGAEHECECECECECETSVHVRGHDETETRRGAADFTGWEMGGVRRGGCRSRRDHENLPSLDRA